MELIPYFNKVFNRATFADDNYTYLRIRRGVFFTLNRSGLFIDMTCPKVITLTKHYTPTKKRIDAMKDLSELLKWEYIQNDW